MVDTMATKNSINKDSFGLQLGIIKEFNDNSSKFIKTSEKLSLLPSPTSKAGETGRFEYKSLNVTYQEMG